MKISHGNEAIEAMLAAQELESLTVDPETIVRNIKTSKVEVREKIFVDKPISKQLEVTMEQMQKFNNSTKKAEKGPEKRGSFEDEEIQASEDRKQSAN